MSSRLRPVLPSTYADGDRFGFLGTSEEIFFLADEWGVVLCRKLQEGRERERERELSFEGTYWTIQGYWYWYWGERADGPSKNRSQEACFGMG